MVVVIKVSPQRRIELFVHVVGGVQVHRSGFVNG
jgi:hypothetical protein